MGKSNNPAKRAAQEAELRAKKSRANRASGFLKFILVLVLSVAVCGPFFAGLATIPASNNPVTTPAPAVTQTPIPVPVTTSTDVPTIAATAPAGQ